MKFTGAECAFCKKKFEEGDDVVVCPICGSPHHRECWKENGGCANSSLHKDNFSWEMPEDLLPKEQPKEQPKVQNLQEFKFKNGENAVQCPHCGAINYGNDEYCLKCQKPLHEKSENILIPDSPDAKTAEEQNLKNFQENLRRFGGLDPASPVDSIPAGEMSDYIGGKNPGRIIRKIASMGRYGKTYSFSFAAFFFGPIWFFYRKLIKEGLVYTLLLSLIMVTSSSLFASTTPAQTYYKGLGDLTEQFSAGEITQEEYLDEATELQENFSSTVYSGSDKGKYIIAMILDYSVIFLQLFYSMKALEMYRKKIKKDILSIRPKCTDFPSYQAALRKAGGTSIGGVILGVALVILVQALATVPYTVIMFR